MSNSDTPDLSGANALAEWVRQYAEYFCAAWRQGRNAGYGDDRVVWAWTGADGLNGPPPKFRVGGRAEAIKTLAGYGYHGVLDDGPPGFFPAIATGVDGGLQGLTRVWLPCPEPDEHLPPSIIFPGGRPGPNPN